jgi:nickel-dependent lactate racemase
MSDTGGPEGTMRKVPLLSGAWFGDHTIEIAFPSAWDVTVVGRKEVRALSEGEMRERLRRPFGTPPLAELARGRRRAAIVIDDITRPTPTASILPLLLEELEAAGMPREAITVVVACGAHHVATRDEIARKVGGGLHGGIAVVPHDSDADVVPLGKTDGGTPILVNRAVAECDLKIGVGGIYPHRVAGYSGGAKIIAPGVCGTGTIRYLHDYFRGGGPRMGFLDNEMRIEIENVARKVGLSFIVNVVLNQERRIAGLFAGDMRHAFREGVAAADALYGVNPPIDADVIVSNAYPFDTSLGYRNRGFWPFEGARGGATNVIVGAAPMGRGIHKLSTFDQPVPKMIWRRVKEFRPADRRHWKAGLKVLRRVATRSRRDFLVLSSGITAEDLRAVHPGATLFREWGDLLGFLERKHPGPAVKVAVYPCAPLQIPAEEREGR